MAYWKLVPVFNGKIMLNKYEKLRLIASYVRLIIYIYIYIYICTYIKFLSWL